MARSHDARFGYRLVAAAFAALFDLPQYQSDTFLGVAAEIVAVAVIRESVKPARMVKSRVRRWGSGNYLLAQATAGAGWTKVATMLIANIVTALNSITAETGSHDHALRRYCW